jgi:hypothetical protein
MKALLLYPECGNILKHGRQFDQPGFCFGLDFRMGFAGMSSAEVYPAILAGTVRS